jgi:hypothetical protein
VVGCDLLERAQDRGGGEEVVGRQLEEVHALGERRPCDRDRGDAGSVPGEHVDQPGWERAHTSGPAGGVDQGRPAVEAVASDLLLDLELERRAVEDPTDRPVCGIEDARPEWVDGDAGLERTGHVFVVVGVEPSAELHEEIDDLFDGHVERRAGLYARPHEVVEIERGGEEPAVGRARALVGGAHRPALDEVGHGQRRRRG